MLEQSVKIFEKHQERILKEAAAAFDFELDKLKRLGSFESFVYEFEKNRRPYILKITHSLHRTRDLIMGELDWVDFLAAQNVSVCGILHSVNGKLVETVEMEDSYFLVYVYGKAAGEFTGPDNWNDQLFELWGQIIGRMNKAASCYKPSHPAHRRFHWFEDESLKAEKYLPVSQKKVIDICHSTIDKLKNLPADRGSYGIIHSDLHHGNFKVKGKTMTVFDFDDCHYNYFAYDIAIPVYYVLLDKAIGINNIPYARNFMVHFMAGYRREYQIDSSWLERIPDFLKLRELDLYIIIHRENAAAENDWCRRFMAGKRQMIENNVPVIDLDFSEF
jgi:Ser/Thr protein kinase RdoA (MazF antagonist)